MRKTLIFKHWNCQNSVLKIEFFFSRHKVKVTYISQLWSLLTSRVWSSRILILFYFDQQFQQTFLSYRTTKFLKELIIRARWISSIENILKLPCSNKRVMYGTRRDRFLAPPPTQGSPWRVRAVPDAGASSSAPCTDRKEQDTGPPRTTSQEANWKLVAKTGHGTF